MNASIDKARMAGEGIEALRRGDSARAQDAFQRIIAAGAADASTHVGLAFALRSRGDVAGAMGELDRALALEPRNIQALIVKGDFVAEAGDARTAASFYRAAVTAAGPSEKLPPELREAVGRAAATCARYAAQFESHLERWIAERGPGAQSARFRESLDLLLGRKQIYFQSPRYYYFPGLPQIQFYDRALFPFLDEVERATPEIRVELEAVMRDESAFRPYVEGQANRPHVAQHGMLDNPAWSAFYLWKNGDRIDANAARCPRTMKALEHVPLARVPNRSPSVLFSLLRPGAHIPPHTGMVNTRLICHLPLVVPGACRFRVGNETRDWVEGEAWVFDDTMEHEAWNRSAGTRVILLFEIWKPELSAEERSLVNTMFEAIDAHSGEKPAWEI